MYDGSIVNIDGVLYKRIMGQWVHLAPDPGVRYPDEWIQNLKFEVVAEAGPLDDVAEGTVVACSDGSVVAVYQGNGEWPISGAGEWFTTDEMLVEMGIGWKVIYKAGDNDA